MTYEQKEFTVALVGNPNVGKSVIFHSLTGRYATVSNYPGTTVDITTGTMKVGEHHNITVIDTPGFYNLTTITEEERVTKKILLERKPDAVLHVIDAKNIERMLPLTLQLREAGFPVILVLNMFDELLHRGLNIQISHLEHDLGIPVVRTIATKGDGIDNLKSRIVSVVEDRYSFNTSEISYPAAIETRIAQITSLLNQEYPVSHRALSLLLLQGDEDAQEIIKDEMAAESVLLIAGGIDAAETRLAIAHTRHKAGEDYTSEHFKRETAAKGETMKKFVDAVTMHPIAGLVVVGLILYYGFFKFVGEFGAGTLVDFIEADIFEAHINPYVNIFFEKLVGGTIFFDLFAGEYGIITLGVRYAVAIVLPVVFSFFLLFSLLEDSGYLTRLSMTLNNMFRKFGLSGRSVIPMVLGLGCGTMATVVTRTLETKRERYIVAFLLAIAVPCGAQMGVILGILGESGDPTGLWIWFFTILTVFILAGLVLRRFTKGEDATFFMELPPIRWPKPVNVVQKTYNRMKWYAIEVIPLFIYASIAIWVGRLTHLFDLLTGILKYPARWAGLPDSMGEIFLYGFFRRDFGAAGLLDMANALSMKQLVVSSVVLTLFIPCVAQFSVLMKEQSVKTALMMFAFIVPFAFATGVVLNMILTAFGV